MKTSQMFGIGAFLFGAGAIAYVLLKRGPGNGVEGVFCQLKVDGELIAADVEKCAGDHEITITVDNNTNTALTSVDITWGLAMVAQGVSIPARGYQEFSKTFTFSVNSGRANIAYRPAGGDWIQCSGWIAYNIVVC